MFLAEHPTLHCEKKGVKMENWCFMPSALQLFVVQTGWGVFYVIYWENFWASPLSSALIASCVCLKGGD